MQARPTASLHMAASELRGKQAAQARPLESIAHGVTALMEQSIVLMDQLRVGGRTILMDQL